MKTTCHLLILCLLFLTIDVSCKKAVPPTTDINKERQKLVELGQIMHISFPSSARLLNYKHQRGMDDVILLKIEIPRDDIKKLIEGSLFSNKVLRCPEDNPIPHISITGPQWWKVKSVKKWESGQVKLPDTKYLNILLDLDRQDKIIVYLEWFET